MPFSHIPPGLQVGEEIQRLHDLMQEQVGEEEHPPAGRDVSAHDWLKSKGATPLMVSDESHTRLLQQGLQQLQDQWLPNVSFSGSACSPGLQNHACLLLPVGTLFLPLNHTTACFEPCLHGCMPLTCMQMSVADACYANDFAASLHELGLREMIEENSRWVVTCRVSCACRQSPQQAP
jgi:hypothetical protein